MIKLKVSMGTINKILLCALASLMVFTPFYPFQKMILIMGLFFLWLLTAISIDGRFILKEMPTVVFLVLFVFLDFVDGLVNGSTTTMLLGVNKMPTFVWFLIYQFYRKRIHMVRWPIIVIFGMVAVSGVFTLVGNLMYPGASRMLANVLDYYAAERELYRSMNIGGYGFIYSVAFLTAPVLLMIRTMSKKSILAIVFLGLLILNVVLGAYFIAIMFTFMLLFICLSGTKRIWTVFIGMIVLLLLTTLFSRELLQMLTNIADMIGSDILVRRAEELLTGSYFDTLGDSNNRITIYISALKNWIQRPILGSLQGGNIVQYRSGHSALLGYLESYGLLAILYYVFFYRAYMSGVSMLRNSYVKTQYQFFYLCFMALLTVNIFNTACDLGMTMFFVIPALYQLCEADMANAKRKGAHGAKGIRTTR